MVVGGRKSMDSSLAASVTTAVLFFLLRNSELCTLRSSLICSKRSIVSFHVRCKTFMEFPLFLWQTVCAMMNMVSLHHIQILISTLDVVFFEQALLLQLVTKERSEEGSMNYWFESVIRANMSKRSSATKASVTVEKAVPKCIFKMVNKVTFPLLPSVALRQELKAGNSKRGYRERF